MSIATPRLVAGADRYAALHGPSLPQVDELCGCFHAHLALRACGIDVDQEAVGLRAGSVLSAGRSHDVLPNDERGREPRCAFPETDAAHSGTAAAGLVRAVDELSGAAVATIPVAGPWTTESVRALLDAATTVDGPLTLAANVATAEFWGARPTPAQVLAYLASSDHSRGPAPDWDVGHFVSLLGTIDGAAGSIVLVADTYPSLGLDGVHLQPIERVAAALRRERFPGDGGVLAILPAASEPTLRATLLASGFALEVWDNGSPDALAG